MFDNSDGIRHACDSMGADQGDDHMLPLDSAVDGLPPLPPAIWTNLLKMTDRFLSVAIGPLERREAEKRAISDGIRQIIKRVSAGNAAGITDEHAQYARVLLTRGMRRIAGEELNLNSIASYAVDELRKQPAGSEHSPAQDVPISDEFLDAFEPVAKTKGTEYMQRLFARILAGEVRRPGSFSLRTIKVAEQLDQRVAQLFRNLCSLCCELRVDIRIPDRTPEYQTIVNDIRVVSMNGDPNQSALSDYGLGYEKLTILQDYGLVAADCNTSCDYWFCVRTKNKTATTPLRHQGRDWILVPFETEEEFATLRLSGVMLSAVGRELFPIVEKTRSETYTQGLRDFFLGKNLQMAELK